jgi:hypothetical protein
MKKLIVLAVAGLFATSANAEVKWSGSAGWRYEQTKQDDNLNSVDANGRGMSAQKTKAHGVRANLGATGGWQNVEWGVGVRTQAAAAVANNDYTTVRANAGDVGIGFEQAWFRYLRDFGSMDMSVTIGRQLNVLAYDGVSQNLFDNDVRFDGFGWQFRFGMFGLNAAQYILGARNDGAEGRSTHSSTESSQAAPGTTSRMNYLLAFQPHMTWKFRDDIETMFAVGYYLWNDSSNANATNGGVNAGGWNTGSVAPVAASTLNIHNPRQWHFLNTWSLPYNLSFNAEFVLNKETAFNLANVGNGTVYTGTVFPAASKSAWAATLTYGSLQKARDFTVAYGYGNKGLGSVINAFSYEKFAADNKGHSFNLGYALADNFHVGAKALFLKEKERLNPLTGLAYAGANANQELKTSYWELTAGVMF